MLPQASAVPARRQAILLALTSYALFTAQDTVVKLLGAHWHVLQVMLHVSIGAMITAVLIALARGGLHRLKSRLVHLHAARWTISFGSSILIFSAFAAAPIADVYAILFTSPLIVTAISVVVLGEQVGWRRWTAVAVGFSGVLVMLHPESGVSVARLIMLGAACLHASGMVFIRWMRSTEPVEIFAFYGNILTVIVAGLAMPWLGTMPTLGQSLAGILAGMVSGGAFILIVRAYQLAEAGIIAPFQYSQMVYGVIVGFLLFHDLPDRSTITGALIVAASGIYVFHREAVRRRVSPA